MRDGEEAAAAAAAAAAAEEEPGGEKRFTSLEEAHQTCLIHSPSFLGN